MTTEPSQPITAVAPEARVEKRAVPVWLLILLLLLLYWGMLYFDHHGGWFSQEVYAPYTSLTQLESWQPRTEGVDLARGRALYETVCALCHNTDGSGKPNQAPPLAGGELAIGSANRMIPIPLVGMAGPLNVKGQDWNLSMPAMGAAMSDEELSAVLSYIRKSWGNNASEITPEQVKVVRAELSGHPQQVTPDELMARPEK